MKGQRMISSEIFALLMSMLALAQGAPGPDTCDDRTPPPAGAQLYIAWSDQGLTFEQSKTREFSDAGGSYQNDVSCDPVIFFHGASLRSPDTNTTGTAYVSNATEREAYWSLVVDAKVLNITRLPGADLSFDVQDVRRHPGMTSLALRGGVMPTIPPGFFDYDTFAATLYLLDLTGNNITSLEQRVFENLHRLSVFVFSDNPLKQYDPALFCGMSGLSSITMNNAFHAGFPTDIFSQSSLSNQTNCDLRRSLSYPGFILRLSRNNFTVIPNAAMDAVTELKKLHVAGSSVRLIHPDAFRGLDKLTDLFLEDNEFEELPDAILTPLTALYRLISPNNRMKTISGDHFATNLRLNEIDLSNNNLMLISGSFSHLGRLKSFNANGNKLTSVPAGAFSNTSNLQNLSFIRNNISYIEGSFRNMRGGRYGWYLYLDHNDITELDAGVFHESSRMRGLSLAHNRLTQLHAGLFSQQPRFRLLDLNHNMLESLACDGFPDQLRLEVLNASYNNINQLCDTIFQSLPNLKELDLSYNDVSTLTAATLNTGRSLQLYLGDNPWDCECHLQSLATWVMLNQDKVQDVDDMRCVSPPAWQNQTILSTNITCESTTTMPSTTTMTAMPSTTTMTATPSTTTMTATPSTTTMTTTPSTTTMTTTPSTTTMTTPPSATTMTTTPSTTTMTTTPSTATMTTTASTTTMTTTPSTMTTAGGVSQWQWSLISPLPLLITTLYVLVGMPY